MLQSRRFPKQTLWLFSDAMNESVSHRASATDETRSGSQQPYVWGVPTTTPHTSFWHCSGMPPLTAQSHPGAHWAAKYNVSFQRRHLDERNRVNCLDYNRNLHVKPPPFPWQLGLTSPPGIREQAVELTLLWLSCRKKTRFHLSCESRLLSM